CGSGRRWRCARTMLRAMLLLWRRWGPETSPPRRRVPGRFLRLAGDRPQIAMSSSDFPDFSAASNQRGLRPRPVQVSDLLAGLAYFALAGLRFRAAAIPTSSLSE